jgi:hypothetical protein
MWGIMDHWERKNRSRMLAVGGDLPELERKYFSSEIKIILIANTPF